MGVKSPFQRLGLYTKAVVKMCSQNFAQTISSPFEHILQSLILLIECVSHSTVKLRLNNSLV